MLEHSKPNGTGVLKYALLHSQNEFMQNLIESYHSWISSVTKSDNCVKHVKSLKTVGFLDRSKHSVMPDFIESVIYDSKQDIHYDKEIINQIIHNCYELINKTIQYAIDKI